MNRILFLLFVFVFVLNESFGQTAQFSRYLVEFTDKNNSPFSIDNPSAFLSDKAIARRLNFDIAVVESDLPVNPDYIQQVVGTGVSLLNVSKWFNSISIATSDSLALLAIQQFTFVKSVNVIAPFNSTEQLEKLMQEDETGNMMEDASQYGFSFNQINMLAGEFLHDEGYRGEEMMIAVLDAGFSGVPSLSAFENLINESRLLATYNFVGGNDTVFHSSNHGTAVLSTMAANEGGVMIGTAPKASFLLYLSEDVLSEYPIEEHNWAAAAEKADSTGADIITSSLGYSLFENSLFNHTYNDMDGNTTIVTRAADLAASKGMIVCSSAGNEGNDVWHYITAPADADSIITVGAVGPDGMYASFSSYGPSFDGQVKPTVVGQGFLATVIEAGSGIPIASSGTSFSNPIIAGMTACLWQAHRDKNNMEIIEAIKRSASHYSRPNDSLGYGVPNFYVAHLLLSDLSPEELELNLPLLYPNPFTDQFNVIYFSNEKVNALVEFFDALGRIISSFDYEFQAGYNLLPFDQFESLPNGNYFLRFQFPAKEQVLIRTMKMRLD